jgi:hypothetical protein
MIYVFKTSVQTEHDIRMLKPKLDKIAPRWNFDLEDRDNILKVDSHKISPGDVILLLEDAHFECQELM